jgi:hypothetical protein
MKNNLMITIEKLTLPVLLMIFAGSGLSAQDFNTLPDRTKFTFWNDMTKYSKMYHVSKTIQIGLH